MRVFTCPVCGGAVYPGNLFCGCGAPVAYDPDAGTYVSAEAPCSNRATISCDWIADRGAGGALCRSCAMTEVVPDSFHSENVRLWAEAEGAKRWTLIGLARWGWFTADDPGPRPVFHLLSGRTRAGEADIMMGHADGVVTIDVAESDRAERVKRQEALGESYRTMIGHFRHEIAHMIFERLGGAGDFLATFRDRFGDERWDYDEHLRRYYAEGPVPDWSARHLSPYASMHPHEDWAETVSHLLHLADIVDSAEAAGARVGDAPPPGYDAYAETDAERLITLGVDLGLGLNHVNRAMGLSDLYPFVLGPVAREKLIFAHRWLKDRGAAA